MVYSIYFYWNLQFLNHVIIIKTKVLLHQLIFSDFYYCKSVNFRGFSQLDKFVGIFFRIFLIAQKQKKMYFSVNQFISTADDVLYWQDKIVLRITFVMWNLLTLFHRNSELTYVHSL